MEEPQTSFDACNQKCTEISAFVNSEFAKRMRQTQQIEEAGGDPRKGLQ